MEISNPIIFHDPLEDRDFGIEDLKTAVIPPSPQQEWLVSYRDSVSSH